METEAGSWTYFMALAWLCTRDQLVVDRIEKLAADHTKGLTADEAKAAVKKEWLRVERRSQQPQAGSEEIRFEALIEELDNALTKGGLRSTGIRRTSADGHPTEPIAIPRKDWSDYIWGGKAHDTIRALPGEGDPNDIIYRSVRLFENEVKIRWPGRQQEDERLEQREHWTLSQAAYWVKNRSLQGFTVSGYDSMDDFEALPIIHERLRSGKLICTTQALSDYLGHSQAGNVMQSPLSDDQPPSNPESEPFREETPSAEAKQFWHGHSPIEFEDALFLSSAVRKLPSLGPGLTDSQTLALLRSMKFDTKGDAVRHLIIRHGFKRDAATEAATKAGVEPRPGRRKRKSGTITKTE